MGSDAEELEDAIDILEQRLKTLTTLNDSSSLKWEAQYHPYRQESYGSRLKPPGFEKSLIVTIRKRPESGFDWRVMLGNRIDQVSESGKTFESPLDALEDFEEAFDV